MLRIIAAVLFAANLLLLGWHVTRAGTDDPAQDSTRAAAGDIPTIDLLSEALSDGELLAENRFCFSVGPLVDSGVVDALRDRLERGAVHVSERQTQAWVELGHWVYIPPRPLLEDAEMLARQMEAAGIEDLFVKPDRKGGFHVSLGFYGRAENADARVAELKAAGFEAKSAAQRENQDRFWFDYELQAGDDLLDDALEGSGEQAWRRTIPCPEWPEPQPAVELAPLVSNEEPETATDERSGVSGF